MDEISTKENNVCFGCPTYCCIGFGRMLVNQEELNRLFKFHSLRIEKEGRLFRISVTNEKEHCPYLHYHRCTNYDQRPFDCRLYPLIIDETKETKGEIIAFYKFHQRCPQVKFFKSIWTTSDLEKIKAWLKEVYPDKAIRLIYRCNGLIKRNLARLKRILVSTIK